MAASVIEQTPHPTEYSVSWLEEEESMTIQVGMVGSESSRPSSEAARPEENWVHGFNKALGSGCTGIRVLSVG
jgi:hypothetical protein